LENIAMRKFIFPLLTVFAAGLMGCESSEPPSPAQTAAMHDEARAALERMQAQDSTVKYLVDNSYGYVVFPEIGEGAVGIGGASGKGIVYQSGHRVGEVNLTQASLGIQIGGQTFAELIVFQNQKALNRLMNDGYEFGADASATFVKEGAAGSGDFVHGVRIFILPKGGLMAGLSLNGQKFHFTANTQQWNQQNQNDQNENNQPNPANQPAPATQPSQSNQPK